MNTPSRTDTPPTKLADSKPSYPDERTARADGFVPVTSWFYAPAESELAQAVHDSLSGAAPGSRPVRFAVIGTRARFLFARLRAELADVADAPEPLSSAPASKPQAA